MQLNKLLSTLKYIILAGLLCTIASCKDSDSFSSDGSLRLEFETELIQFDTIFTSLGSTTKKFKIYNRNKHSLNITSATLKNSEKSGFRLNIDGAMGATIYDIDVLKKDNISAFVKLSVNPLDKNSPVVIRDTIEFLLNGNKQYVALEAIGQDVYICKGKRIEANTTFDNKKPYLIYDSLVVEENKTLTIQEGAKLNFRNKASFIVYGNVQAQGSIDKPILLRGDRFDNIDGNISYDNVSGQWKGIYFGGKSYDNVLENFYVRNAVDGMIFDKSNPLQKKADLKNVIVHNNSNDGVVALNCYIDAVNCLFTNARGSVLRLSGGKYSFTHCTLANYYRWSNRTARGIVLSNILPDMTTENLSECTFVNTIVAGNLKDEIHTEGVTGYNLNFLFKNCLLKQTLSPENNFDGCLWNFNPKFANLGQQGDYVYDFALTAESPAINNGNIEGLAKAPKDIRGKNRNDGKPDIGCHEWTVEN